MSAQDEADILRSFGTLTDGYGGDALRRGALPALRSAPARARFRPRPYLFDAPWFRPASATTSRLARRKPARARCEPLPIRSSLYAERGGIRMHKLLLAGAADVVAWSMSEAAYAATVFESTESGADYPVSAPVVAPKPGELVLDLGLRINTYMHGTWSSGHGGGVAPNNVNDVGSKASPFGYFRIRSFVCRDKREDDDRHQLRAVFGNSAETLII
jgi:hypothetical protein